MKIYLIAQIMEGNKVWGFRLLDVDDNNKINDYPVISIKNVLSNPNTSNIIQNVKLVNGELTGSNGQLSRYAKITRNGMLISSHGESPLVIINKIDDIGYTVANYSGAVKKMKNSDVVEYAKSFGIANGKIVVQDSVEYISSISDSYEQISVSPSKVGAKGKVNISIPMNMDKSSIAKHTENDINTELQYSDVFSAMSPEQRLVLKQYYTWYTVDTYEKLAKNVRLNLAPGKAEKLAQLRGIEKWKFAGVNDSYLEGRFNAKCELGHSLRYEYFAIPEDDTEDLSARTRDWHNYAFRTTRGTQDELRDRGAIVFGETCAGDFFNIAPEDMKKLVKVRKQMSEEIELLADIITNKAENIYVQKCEFLYMVLRELNTPDRISKVFGDRVGYTLMAFLKTKMPFPKSLVILAGNEARRNIETFFTEVFKDTAKFSKIVFNNKNSNTFYKNVYSMYKYIVDFTIEGDYKYDPLNDKDNTRRDIGAYNKETRLERKYLINSIKAGTLLYIENVDIEKFKIWLNTISRAYEINEKVVDYINKSGTIQESIKNSKATSLINNVRKLAENTDIIPELEALNIYDYMVSILSMSCTYASTSYLAIKTRAYSATSWRSTCYRQNIQEFIDIQNTVLELDSAEFLDKTIGLYVKSIEKDLEKEKEIILNTPKFYEVELKEDSELFNKYNNIPVLIKCIREEKDWMQDVINGKGNRHYILHAYMRDMVEIPCDEINEDCVRELTESEYINKKDCVYRILRSRELEQIHKEREEREAEEARKAEEEKRKAEEEKRKAEEAQLKEFEQDETMKKLEQVLNDNKDVVDYGTDIARDILSKKLPFSKLSSKQQWRVKETISRLSKDSEDSQKIIENDKKKLEDNPDVAKKVDKLLEINKGKDKDAIQKVNSASRIAFDIARTMKFKGEYSSKQLKHIEKAIEALK